MSSFPDLDIQTAVFERLNNHSSLNGMIYDAVPDNTSQPYITIGEISVSQWDTNDIAGAEVEINVHTWVSNQLTRGRKTCKEYMEIIHGLLDNYDLDIDGHNCVLLRHEFSNTDLDPDGITYHGTQRFRMLTQEE